MEQRLQTIVDQLNEYAEQYYRYDNPTVTDGEYDALFDELLALEKQTGIILPDSPTRRVAERPFRGFHSMRIWEGCGAWINVEAKRKSLPGNSAYRSCMMPGRACLRFVMRWNIK